MENMSAPLDGDGLYFNATEPSFTVDPLDPEIENMKVSLEEMRFVVQLILVPIVAFIGVFGNMTTMAVLTRKQMRSSTNYYLTALALSDMMYLLMFFSLSLSHHPGMNGSNTWIYWQFFKYALWFNDASSATSTWLTVTFTVERYIAVCHPMLGKVFCTPSRALKLIIGVYIFCYGLTATTPHEWVVMTEPEEPGNGTYSVYIAHSALGDNDTYRTVFFWFTAVVFTLLPLLLLSIFNSFLINTVQKSSVQRKTLSERPTAPKNQDRKITVMLIAVVVLALVCQTPAAIALLYSTFHKPLHNSRDDYAMRFVNNLFNLMSACNAALNFVLYCALSNKFRKTFMETFCQRLLVKPSPQHTEADRISRASSVHYSRRNSRRSSNTSSTSRLSPPPHTTTGGGQYLAVPANPSNSHPAGEQQNAPLLQK